MDVQRTDQHIRRRSRRIVAGIAILAFAGIATEIVSLKPALPAVDRGSVWVGTVRRGPMLRQVRGIGTLVPVEIEWIAARTVARVDKIVMRPGAAVAPDSVVLVLSNPELQQAAKDADSRLIAAQADVVSLQTQLESSKLAAESTAATAKAEYEQSSLKAEVNERLFNNGLVSELELRLSRVTAQQAKTRDEIEQKRLEFARTSIEPQLAMKRTQVDQRRAEARLRHEELDALSVRAGMTGVLQSVPVEVGAQVSPGTNLARVANPTQLKAVIRVPETQARDVLLGQVVSIDTRGAIIEGRVNRIDPSVQNGTVTVDVALGGSLPPGMRSDLAVEGVIEIQRLNNVLFVERPSVGEDNSTTGMFKLDPSGRHASRTSVRFGRSSVNTIEVVSGLQVGDQVILSDMSQWEKTDRVRLNQ